MWEGIKFMCSYCHQPANKYCPKFECEGYRIVLCDSCSIDNMCTCCGEFLITEEELNEIAEVSMNGNMVVKIKNSDIKNTWYENSVEEEFDVVLRKHPTFGYFEYILKNTERNKLYFKEDELSLMMLEHGFMGIRFTNAEEICW